MRMPRLIKLLQVRLVKLYIESIALNFRKSLTNTEFNRGYTIPQCIS